jgi:ATP-dependent Clp protease ATP-binding subunit ClpA
MFERFTADARSIVVGAQQEAKALHNPSIGSEQLLLSMVSGQSAGTELLTTRGMNSDALREQLRAADGALDPVALATLGIDLGKVRDAVENAFGPGALDRRRGRMPSGHIPFTKPGKKTLEFAVREAVGLGSTSINSVHLLLGIIREDGNGARLIRDAGIDLEELAADARIRAAGRAA